MKRTKVGEIKRTKAALPPPGQMMRGKSPANIIKRVEYFDKNKAQRLGIVVSETRNHLTVKNWHGDVENVERRLIVKEWTETK